MEMFKFICAILLCANICFFVQLSSAKASDSRPQIACLDEQGNEVDWYIGYKFPKVKHSGDQRFQSGYAYAYITSENVARHQRNEIRSENVESLEKNKTEKSEFSQFLHKFTGLLISYAGVNKKYGKNVTSSLRTMNNNDDNVERWSMSSLRITNDNSVLLRTLKPAYDERVNAILYNDDGGEIEVDDDDSESEDSETDSNSGDSSSGSGSGSGSGGKKRVKRDNSSTRAHAKGVLMLDEQRDNGIWLTHSIPRFPPRLNQPLEFPVSAQYYGQTFMCISFKLQKSANNLIDHLRTMQPHVFDVRVNEQTYEMFPKLKDLDTRQNMKAQRRRASRVNESKLVQTITTSGGQALNLFSKSKKFADDMWAGWIDEELKSALYVETWRRGAGTPLNSFCPPNKYHTNNVKDLKYDNQTNWSYLNDHSKWAISDEQQHAYVCIGDVNRMESQFKRGGGAVCIKCPNCWKIFSNTILDVEPCPKNRQKPQKQT